MVALIDGPSNRVRTKEVAQLQQGRHKPIIRGIVADQMIAGALGVGRDHVHIASQPADGWLYEKLVAEKAQAAGLKCSCVGVENDPTMLPLVVANKPVFAQVVNVDYAQILFWDGIKVDVAGMRAAENALYGSEGPRLVFTNTFDDGMGVLDPAMMARTVSTLNRIVPGGTVHVTFVIRVRNTTSQRRITDMLGAGLLGKENRDRLMEAFAGRVLELTRPGTRHTASLQYTGGYNAPMAVIGFSNGVDLPLVRRKLATEKLVESNAA